jgi:hypothetical protein
MLTIMIVRFGNFGLFDRLTFIVEPNSWSERWHSTSLAPSVVNGILAHFNQDARSD